MTTKKNIKIIISGGGTGGHVYPAIAIANEVKRQYPEAEIRFVGAQGKMEMEKVPKAGYPIDGLWISGFQRRLTLQNLMFPIKLLNSLWKARGILKKFKPDLAIGVGGYASYPTLAMASWMGIPTMIQEQNSYAGVSNKMLKESVQKVCVAYDNMEKYFPANKIIKTGNPVRSDIWEMGERRVEALSHFRLKDKKTILVFGGSLGAKTLNKGMKNNTAALKAVSEEVQVIWQAGKFYIDEYKNCETAKLDNVKISMFIDRMDLAYAAADVVICRAGALTISELCLVGKAAILIPSPNVTGDHQTKNANALTSVGAAVMLKDADGQQMIEEALQILKDEKVKEDLEVKIKKMAKPNAAAEIVAVAEGLIK